MQNLFDLTNKKAIVTGGASGLGRAMAEALYDSNAEVCIIDVSDKLEKVAGEISKNGRKVHTVKANLANREEVKSGFAKALETLGGIDILVNSAGTQKRHKSEDFPIEDWDTVIELNLTTVFSMCQLAGREMIKQGHGKIINIASMLTFMGGFTVPAYAASKGGVAQLTKTLTNEWGPKGVNINAIAPGWMDTPLTEALVGNPEREPAILARTPAGRWGKPEDLKGTVIFLASKASDFLNGVVIPVDGGYLAK